MSLCLNPVSITSPYKYCEWKPWTLQKRIDVPCNKCFNCLQNRKDSWKTRLKNELSSFGHAYFCTVTYDDDHLPIDDNGVPTFRYSDFQLFMKRLRQFVVRGIDKLTRVSYFVVAEYGDKTGRPHYHFLLFGLPVYYSYQFRRFSNKTKKWELRTRVPFVEDILHKCWKNGVRVEAGLATPGCISYMVDYMLKPFNDYPDRAKEFYRMSTRPFIGFSWFMKHESNFRQWNFRYHEGKFSHALPKVYLKKYFLIHGEKAHDRYLLDCFHQREKRNKELLDLITTLRNLVDTHQITESDFLYFSGDPTFFARAKLRKFKTRVSTQSIF